MKLTDDDFPVKAIGPLVYARTWSSPIATCTDDEMAADVAERLNTSSRVVAIQSIDFRNLKPGDL